MRRVLVVLLALSLLIAWPPGPAAAVGYGWPVTARPQVVRAFDPPAQRWLSGHRGVDLRADAGQPVLSPTDGTVTFSGTVVDRQVITVQDAGGRRHSFEPVTEPLAAGTVVRRGDRLALVAPGHCTAGCVHWGVRQGRTYVDPLGLLARPRAVLLPTGRVRADPPVAAGAPARLRPGGSRPASPAGTAELPRSRSPPGSRRQPATASRAAAPPLPGRRCSSW